jgi:hypothetical protein
MLRTFIASLAALAALAPHSAHSAVCALDPVPGATLLLPYFELDARDLGKPKASRGTTLLSITTHSGPKVARVTLWTDLGVPTLAFDLSLAMTAEVDLRRVLQGTLPGDLAVSCTDGEQTTRELPPERVEALRLAHGGKPDASSGLCSGIDHGDTLVRGYVTIDVVAGCVSTPRSTRATPATSEQAASLRTTTPSAACTGC